MTERHHRLQEAGLLLVRAGTAIGGVLGAIVFFVALNAQERLISLFLIFALAMPLTLFVLAASASRPSGTEGRRAAGGMITLCLIGATFSQSILFVDADGYLALMLVVLTGVLLTVGVQVAARIRQVPGGIE